MLDPIIVIGPGRCGTSAVAGMLHHMGIDMGDYLKPPDAHNPRGYFEDDALRVLLNKVLGREINLATFHPRLEEWVYWRRSANRLWGFKHPGVSLLLPHVLGHFRSPRFIRCHRNKADTVASMVRCYGRLGWVQDVAARHYDRREAEMDKWLAGYEVTDIEFSDLASDPEAVLDRVANVAGKGRIFDRNSVLTFLGASDEQMVGSATALAQAQAQ